MPRVPLPAKCWKWMRVGIFVEPGMTIYSKQLPSAKHYDIIVVGSGSAGATAAIAAARAGVKTLVLERLPFLGGTSTAVLDTFYGFYTPGSQSRKVVGGISD